MPKIDWDEMTDLFKCNRAFEQVSKAAAGTGTIGDFGRSKYHDDFHHESFNKMMNEAESKAREEIALKALLQNSQTKESNMELQRDSEKYKEFLQLVEESDWIRPNVYKIFYESSEMRRERLLTALYNRKINFQIRDKGKILDDGSQDIDNDYRLFIEDWYFSNSQNSSDCFVLEAKSFLSWLKEEYPYDGKEQVEKSETAKEKISELPLVKILELITPEMYPDGLKGQEKSAITKSVNTLKDQLPEAFELCCSLVMEAMPCEDREEYLKYTRDDIINAAQERGIKRPIALQIHKGFPAVMKK